MNPNESQTLLLPAGQVLTITAPSGSAGRVERLPRLPGGGNSQSTTVIAGADLTFGPYADTERFRVIVTAGTATPSTANPDPLAQATDAELAAALALKADLTAPAFLSVGLPEKTPVNATGTTLTLPVADLAILEAGDTVVFGETTCTMATEPGAGEFSTPANLATLLNAIEGWTGAENAGIVTAVSDALGTAQNGLLATITHLAATTSGGSEVAKAGATIGAAEMAQLAIGDTATFDGATFTMAAATDVPTGEFADVAGLILCIDGLTDWTAADSSGDIAIEAAEVGAAGNDLPVSLIYLRATAGAIAGTVGVANEICADDSFIYHSVGDNTVARANWRRIARGSAY